MRFPKGLFPTGRLPHPKASIICRRIGRRDRRTTCAHQMGHFTVRMRVSHASSELPQPLALLRPLTVRRLAS